MSRISEDQSHLQKQCSCAVIKLEVLVTDFYLLTELVEVPFIPQVKGEPFEKVKSKTCLVSEGCPFIGGSLYYLLRVRYHD